jgi:hypothetical protein
MSVLFLSRREMRASMKWRIIFAVASPPPLSFVGGWYGMVVERLKWMSGRWHSQHGCPCDKLIVHSWRIFYDLENLKMGTAFRYQVIWLVIWLIIFSRLKACIVFYRVMGSCAQIRCKSWMYLCILCILFVRCTQD